MGKGEGVGGNVGHGPYLETCLGHGDAADFRGRVNVYHGSGRVSVLLVLLFSPMVSGHLPLFPLWSVEIHEDFSLELRSDEHRRVWRHTHTRQDEKEVFQIMSLICGAVLRLVQGALVVAGIGCRSTE